MTPAHRVRWKIATRQAVADAGGVEAAADILGLSITQVSRCQTGHAPDLLTLAGALALADASGTRAFAEIFADMAGCRLTQQSDADEAAPCERKALTDCLTESSELIHQIAAALADGTISATERGLIRRAMGNLKDSLADAERAFDKGGM
jgi:hypothetical protein